MYGTPPMTRPRASRHRAPDGRPLTSRDVAELAGVSQTTVSRVLRGSPQVREPTRTKVLEVFASTGYAPNAAARVMRSGRTGTLGVVVARVTNPFYPELLDALGSTIAARGGTMSLWAVDVDGERAALEAIRRRAVDGMLFTTATLGSTSLRTALRDRAPVVLVNRTLPRVACDKVSTDNRGGAAAAARHLLERGHRRIALISGPADVSTAREREQGFRRALERAGRPLDEALCVHGEFSHAEGHAGLLTLLDRGRPPSAVFCVNDVIAFGALDAARLRGIAVPDELSVVGFDDVEMAGWESFSLTTVRQPLEAMAQTAVDYLLERIEGRPPAAYRHARLPAELVIRRSTRPA